jgi:integrase
VGLTGCRWNAGTICVRQTEDSNRTRVNSTLAQTIAGPYSWAWLAARVALAPRTREIYTSQLRLHVLPPISPQVPALGDLPLNALSPDLVRAWYAALRSQRGPSAAAKAYTRLRQILRQAVDDERIAKNPCRINSGGVETHPEQQFASLPDLYGLAEAMPERYRALILTAGLAGLRRGELFALRRADVDLLQGTVIVRRKRLRLASGETIEGAPKSAAGRRDVALPEPLIAELERHLATFTGSQPDAYVFTSAEGQPIEASNFRYRVWLPATKAAGLPGLRVHDLRHTAGTLAARTGATTKELMARLGHASPQAAMVYQHASRDRDRAIADGLTAMTVEAGLAPSGPIDATERLRTGRSGR